MPMKTLTEVATKTCSQLNRPWRRLLYVVLALSFASFTYILVLSDSIDEFSQYWFLPFLRHEPVSSLKSPTDIFRLDVETEPRNHPIDDLISQANDFHRLLLEKETKGVARAAQAYRTRRGRHPPPGFEEWVAFAEARSCLMIEEFFDRIYHDLGPFWAISPRKIRADAAAGSVFIQIRNGVAIRSQEEQPFITSYFDLVKILAPHLPDLDIPVNPMDESRVLVPWHAIAQYMEETQASQKRTNLSSAPRTQTFTALTNDADRSEPAVFVGGPYWDLARQTCPPDTKAATLDVDKDLSIPPTFPTTHPYGTYSGFVQNWTKSQDFCQHTHLRNMHGTFIEPVSISSTASLVPIFSGSKLLTNNDILLPAARYWDDEENFAASKHHINWHEKHDRVFWRGTGSGGRNKVDNWTRFHRHRLVSLLNGTQVNMTLNADNQTQLLPRNFPPPNQALYPLVASKLGLLVDWIRSFSDVAFYWLECFPPTRDFSCSYTGSWYRQGTHISMNKMYLNKYLPDVDGNSFSGRFRAFLMSNSLPIKATIYTEWHDSRLIPWKHFVPMDNTFADALSIFEYLFRYDKQAEVIAVTGRKWAERVLRKDDMLVYVYRLLLEYARVSDPNREDMGYGQDLR